MLLARILDSKAHAVRNLAVILTSLAMVGCSSMYFSAMERLGIEKRDIMVDRVEDARDAQGDARETFRSALERFQSVVGTPDSELKAKYELVSAAFEDSQGAAENVRDRIDGVEEVSEALFEEWEAELDLYQSDALRRSSAAKLRDTREQYARLISRMHEAEDRMDPVLQAFEDQVLFLKHNLNAQAIGALAGELSRIENDVDALIRNMERSIAESEDFIRRLQQ